jgi:hypothetical protein
MTNAIRIFMTRLSPRGVSLHHLVAARYCN